MMYQVNIDSDLEHATLNPVHTIARLPTKLGNCQTECYILEPGFRLVRSSYKPNRPLLEQTPELDLGKKLVLTYCLNGHSAFREQSGSDLSFQAGFVTVSSSHGLAGQRMFDADVLTQQIRIVLDESVSTRYFGAEMTDRLFQRSKHHLVTIHQGRARQNVHHWFCSLFQQSGFQENGDIQSRLNAYQLLGELVPNMKPVHAADQTAPDSRALNAYQLLVDSASSHKSINDIARTVGVSESSLKRLMHQHYQMSPQQIVISAKMELAHTLLQSGMQIAQVGYKLGYSHPNNFSAAFARFYGCSPKRFTQRAKRD